MALLLAALVAAGCGGDDDDDDEPETRAPRGGCAEVDAPDPKPDGGERKPKDRLDPGATYTATLVTNCGNIAIELDVKASPNTTASFVSLARDDFFDRTVFHRIVPGFVIQGGDPTGTGTGGPGYSTRDVPPRGTTYSRGVVAMAKTGEEPPGTAGSQFYIVTGDATQLPPEYAVLGRVVRGLGVATRIGALGDPQSGDAGTPLQPVVVSDVRIDAS